MCNDNEKKFGFVGEGYWFGVVCLLGIDFMVGDV